MGCDGRMQDVPFPVGKSLGKWLSNGGHRDCWGRVSNPGRSAPARLKVPLPSPPPPRRAAANQRRGGEGGPSTRSRSSAHARCHGWARPLPRGRVRGGRGMGDGGGRWRAIAEVAVGTGRAVWTRVDGAHRPAVSLIAETERGEETGVTLCSAPPSVPVFICPIPPLPPPPAESQ